jgi:hypothetical protein
MTGHIPEENIALLAGGDLDPRETANLQQHIVQCPACAAMLNRYREGREAMASLREEELSDAEYDNVRRAVLDRLQVRAVPFFWRWSSLQWMASAAAILLALGLGYIRMRSDAPTRVADTPSLQKTATVRQSASPVAEAPRPAPATGVIREASSAPARRASIPVRKAHPAISTSIANAARDRRPPATEAPAMDDIAIKLETDDPNVVIIWLVSPRGEE